MNTWISSLLRSIANTRKSLIYSLRVSRRRRCNGVLRRSPDLELVYDVMMPGSTSTPCGVKSNLLNFLFNQVPILRHQGYICPINALSSMSRLLNIPWIHIVLYKCIHMITCNLWIMYEWVVRFLVIYFVIVQSRYVVIGTNLTEASFIWLLPSAAKGRSFDGRRNNWN